MTEKTRESLKVKMNPYNYDLLIDAIGDVGVVGSIIEKNFPEEFDRLVKQFDTGNQLNTTKQLKAAIMLGVHLLTNGKKNENS